MKKALTLSILTVALLTGCGGGGEDSQKGNDKSINKKTSTTQVGVGKTDGKYNLWEYMTPSKDRTSNFIETKGDSSSTYKTTYSISAQTVTEVSDYAQNEKTIYTKMSDRIRVSFEKDGTPNGSYDLDLTADIGDIVTVKESTCKLIDHYDEKKLGDKIFSDIIEIRCNDKPGYYQKGIGEVAQTNALSTTGVKTIRILSN
jgi:outer membrane biogenesis lipoprotein LolB